MRTLWFGLGIAAVAAGVVGIVLPLVPTTPFLLLAAFAFSRSSPRFEAWLVDHPRLGPPIRDWRAHRAIGRRAKVVAVGLMASTLVATWAAGVGTTILVVQIVVLAAVSVFILTRPDAPGGDDTIA